MRHGLPDHLRPNVRAALVEARAALAELYGDRLARVVLYGSQARGDARDSSDVDVLVVLRGEVDALAELRRTTGLWWPALRAHGVHLSVHPYDETAFASADRPFLEGVRAEGVEL